MTESGLNVLVTGADGFVGRALCASPEASGWRTRLATRMGLHGALALGEIGPATQWRMALEGVHCVVHLVARTHTREGADFLPDYRRINVAATQNLAQQAAAAGVRRFVFLSSIKVNGESTSAQPYAENDAPRPEDAYGISKWEAEQALWRIAAATRLEVVVLRAPLVYGPGVKGNFLRLLNLVARGVPLPFASLDNRRSLIHVGNVCTAIGLAVAAPQAAGRTYLMSDGEDVSTPALVRAIAGALDVKPRLFPLPPRALRTLAAVLGRSGEAARLTGSLQVDASRIRRELAWQPRHTLAQGLADTARWYRGSHPH